MSIDRSKIDKKRDNIIAGFSSQYMSNSKWTKLFIALSKNNALVVKCLEKSIYDALLRELEIPKIEFYNSVFDIEGIKDVIGGPLKFKEIEWIEFPSKWTIKRKNRSEVLEPIYFYQDLVKIGAIVDSIGIFETESSLDKLKIYGYK